MCRRWRAWRARPAERHHTPGMGPPATRKSAVSSASISTGSGSTWPPRSPSNKMTTCERPSPRWSADCWFTGGRSASSKACAAETGGLACLPPGLAGLLAAEPGSQGAGAGTQGTSTHANDRITMRSSNARYSATGRLPRCSQHGSPGESGGPSSLQRRRSVPIGYEDRLVVPDTLGTTIKLTNSASWRADRLAPADYSQRVRCSQPIYRTGRRDVPRDPLAPGGFWFSGPAPRRYSQPRARRPATECERSRGLSALPGTPNADYEWLPDTLAMLIVALRLSVRCCCGLSGWWTTFTRNAACQRHGEGRPRGGRGTRSGRSRS